MSNAFFNLKKQSYKPAKVYNQVCRGGLILGFPKNSSILATTSTKFYDLNFLKRILIFKKSINKSKENAEPK